MHFSITKWYDHYNTRLYMINVRIHKLVLIKMRLSQYFSIRHIGIQSQLLPKFLFIIIICMKNTFNVQNDEISLNCVNKKEYVKKSSSKNTW